MKQLLIEVKCFCFGRFIDNGRSLNITEYYAKHFPLFQRLSGCISSKPSHTNDKRGRISGNRFRIGTKYGRKRGHINGKHAVRVVIRGKRGSISGARSS